jgi:hypothetical protein
LFFVIWFRALDDCVWVNRVIFPKKCLHCLQQEVWCSDMLQVGGSRDQILVGGKICCTYPDQSWSPPNLLCNGYWVYFLGKKWPERGIDHPPTSSTEVKERVEVYLYSLSGPSWPVVGWKLTLLHLQQEVWFMLMSTNWSSLT